MDLMQGAMNAAAMAANIITSPHLSPLNIVTGFIDRSNRISVIIHQPSFVGGDVVTGSVEMDVLVPFHARSVLLKMKGFERAFWQYNEMEVQGEGENRKQVNVVREVKENKEFFKQTIVVYPHQGTVAPGHYSFPFQYQLPMGLPGTYCEEGTDQGLPYHAKILYKAKATVDVAFRHDLHSTVKLVVNERFEDVVKPSYAENSKTFLLTQGSLSARVWLDKNAYTPGETIVAKLKANNTSTKPTRRITIKMCHYLEMNVHHHRKQIARVDYEREYPGFSPCYYGVKWMLFNIPVNLVRPTSRKGNHIKSSHFFVIECDIPGAIDLSVRLPVDILAPQFLYTTVPPQPAGAPIPPDVSIRPPWQDDHAVSSCNECGKGFTLFNRRHHCRHCSRVFCGKCTPHTHKLPHLKFDHPVRVCNACAPHASNGGLKHQSTKKVMAEWQASLVRPASPQAFAQPNAPYSPSMAPPPPMYNQPVY